MAMYDPCIEWFERGAKVSLPSYRFSSFARMYAYSHIKRLTPHLVIVCLDNDDLGGFQVLSMLKLDEDTKDIPVVTWSVTREDEETYDESFECPDDVFCDPPAMQLN